MYAAKHWIGTKARLEKIPVLESAALLTYLALALKESEQLFPQCGQHTGTQSNGLTQDLRLNIRGQRMSHRDLS